jgi:hypothetical protein
MKCKKCNMGQAALSDPDSGLMNIEPILCANCYLERLDECLHSTPISSIIDMPINSNKKISIKLKKEIERRVR